MHIVCVGKSCCRAETIGRLRTESFNIDVKCTMGINAMLTIHNYLYQKLFIFVYVYKYPGPAYYTYSLYANAFLSPHILIHMDISTLISKSFKVVCLRRFFSKIFPNLPRTEVGGGSVYS